MKTDYGWYSGGNGTNSSGFSGLPGGYHYSGFFDLAGNFGFWWSSSPDGSDAWSRSLDYYVEYVYRDLYDPEFGFSVRCIKDSE